MPQSIPFKTQTRRIHSSVPAAATPGLPAINPWEWLRLAPPAALAAALLAPVGVILSIWCFFLTAEGYVDYGEGLVLFHQTQASQGLNVYDPVFRNNPPYSIPTYGPVFYYLVGAMLPQQPSLLPGRLISILSLLGISGGSWWFLRKRCGAGFPLASMGAVAWLTLRGPYMFGANNRTDSLGIFFGLAALVSTAAFPKAGWKAAIPLLLLAGFTKPTAAVAPALAIFLTLAADHRWKEALCLSLTVLFGALGILQVGDLISDGNFSRCLVFSNANASSLESLQVLTRVCCKQFLLPVGIFLGGFLLRDSAGRIFGLHAIISFAITVATSANVGANVNYFIEPSWAAGFCCALVLHKCPKELMRSVGLALATALVLQSAIFIAPHVVYLDERLDYWPRLVDRLQTYGARGPVLTGECGAQVLIGQSPFLADPHIVKRINEAGRLKIELMLKGLERQEFSAVIAGDDIRLQNRAQNWTHEVRTLVARHYRPLEHIGDQTLFVPRVIATAGNAK